LSEGVSRRVCDEVVEENGLSPFIVKLQKLLKRSTRNDAAAPK